MKLMGYPGSKYINKMAKPETPTIQHLHSDTDHVLKSARERNKRLSKGASERARERWHNTIEHVKSIVHSPAHYRAPLQVATREHMSSLDCCDGARIRSGKADEENSDDPISEDDLLEISPTIDGRLKDIGRPLKG